MDMVDRIIAHETGELDAEGTLELFGELIRSGAAWTLQGSYGRAARDLIDAGWLTSAGDRTERELEV